MAKDMMPAVEGGVAVPTIGTRTMEEITAEAIRHQMNGADAVIGLGNCLIEAKSMLAHGEWLDWLAENLNLSERSAQELMQIARNCSNPRALADLGKKKVLTILTLPPADRALFLDSDYIPEGAEKSVGEMSSRELQDLVRQRDEAQEKVESLKKKLEEKQAASEGTALRISNLEEELTAAREAVEQAKADKANMEESNRKMAEDVRLANAELEGLRNQPVQMAVERDEEAIEAARAETKAAMQGKVDQVQGQLDKANAAKKEAEEKLKAQAAKSQKELEAQKAETDRLQQRVQEMEAAVAAAERKAEEAIKEAGIKSNPVVSAFEDYYNQAQALASKMNGIIVGLVRNDPDTAGKLGKALIALGDAIKEAATVKEAAA